MRLWWERWPQLLERELAALEAAGYQYHIRTQEQRAGTVVMDVRVPFVSDILELVAIYPDTYPYMRVEVYARKLSLRWHQNPFQKNLCLLGRQSDAWSVDDTLAGVLTSQLPDVLRANTASREEQEQTNEERQAEPLVSFLHFLGNSAILFDPQWANELPPGDVQLELHYREDRSRLLGAITDNAKSKDAEHVLSKSVADLFPDVARVRLVRLEDRLHSADAEGVLKQLIEADRHISHFKKPFDVVAISFRDESGWRQDGRGWVFLVRSTVAERRGFRPGRSTRKVLVRAERYSPHDLGLRVPEFADMQKRTVALAGLGCLGAPAALELARAGLGELRLLDYDTVEAGNTVRWPMGIPAVGRLKTDALRDFIAQNYPFTRVVGYRHRLGEVASRPPERVVLDEFLSWRRSVV